MAQDDLFVWDLSPRLSFSHDLSEADRASTAIAKVSRSPAASCDFNFGLSFQTSTQELQLRHADELFSNGKILALPIRMASPSIQPREFKKTGSSWKKIPHRKPADAPAPNFTRRLLLVHENDATGPGKCHSIKSLLTSKDVQNHPRNKKRSSGKMIDINHPRPWIPKERSRISFASYLMCSCPGENEDLGGNQGGQPTAAASANEDTLNTTDPHVLEEHFKEVVDTHGEAPPGSSIAKDASLGRQKLPTRGGKKELLTKSQARKQFPAKAPVLKHQVLEKEAEDKSKLDGVGKKRKVWLPPGP
ncbi:hypothetical protein J5N97_004109 [Dioscorea zingiberensis]|uniref:Uncharacterized protein n=1 Tax=Dioscorea zingiberensis TaxID=325984 RepID=A0A9D5D610_9LILI|nr:hypothetical protein J5N97_004109 [Dioscorea zingiberensis]